MNPRFGYFGLIWPTKFTTKMRRKRGYSFTSNVTNYTNPDIAELEAFHSQRNRKIWDRFTNITFSHSQKLRRIWEYVVLVICFSVIFEITFYGIYVIDMDFLHYIIFIIFDVLYIIDKYVNKKTVDSTMGKLDMIIYQRKRRYIRIIMKILTIISALPISWIGVMQNNRAWYLCLSIPKLFRLRRALHASYTISDNLNYSWSWSKLFQSIMLEFLCVHLFATIFYLSAFFEGIDNSWVKMHGWDDLSPPQQYVVSIYFVMTTIYTIGYGDLTPMTSSERIIVIFIQLIGVMVNAYIIGMMYSALIDKIGSRFKRNFNVMLDFMNFKVIPDDVKNEVIHYFQYRYNDIHGAEDLREVFKFIPETVRDHLKLDMTRQCLSQISLMQVASENLLVGFSNAMRHITFVPGEVIFSQGEIDDELYLFRSGIIRVSVNGQIMRTENCQNGIGMGELELLIDTPRSVTVVAITFVDGWVIDRADLLTSIGHQNELRKELLQACKIAFPDHYKEVRRLLYGPKKQSAKRVSLMRQSINLSGDEQNSSDSLEFVKPLVTEHTSGT